MDDVIIRFGSFCFDGDSAALAQWVGDFLWFCRSVRTPGQLGLDVLDEFLSSHMYPYIASRDASDKSIDALSQEADLLTNFTSLQPKLETNWNTL